MRTACCAASQSIPLDERHVDATHRKVAGCSDACPAAANNEYGCVVCHGFAPRGTGRHVRLCSGPFETPERYT